MSIPNIATRRGDEGETSLGCGTRVDKSDLRIETVGGIDFALAALGRGYRYFDDRGEAHAAEWRAALRGLHEKAFQLMGEVALAEDGKDAFLQRYPGIQPEDLKAVDELYQAVREHLSARGETLSHWRVYGDGGSASAEFFFIRACFRQAELQLCRLRAHGYTVRPLLIAYLNRFSDLLYFLAIYFEAKPSGQDAIGSV